MYKMRPMKIPIGIIKYTICLVLLFMLINLVPDIKTGFKDSFILALLATLSLAVIEHLVMAIHPDIQAERFEKCVEHMDDVSKQEEPVKTEDPVQTEDPVKIEEPVKTEDPVKENTVPEESKPTNVPDQIESEGSRAKDGEILNDLPYDTDFHHLPMADDYKSSMDELGYWFLPPEKWYPTPPFPPVCVSEKSCPVCPVYTQGAPIDVKEWHNAGRITPPDRINTKFIKEKLNSGR